MEIPMLSMEDYEEFLPSADQYHQQLQDHHQTQEVDEPVRKGPWTLEEDNMLYASVSLHGEGRWNSLARHAGLKRTGKSCRLRWLNYLRPSVRRGNISLQEQLLILELHSRWGNRWSKIAQHLPGRTDNEIKNYWRTRVQKQAKQLNCDVNSKQFQDAMRHVWIPRLVERIQSAKPEPVVSATQDAMAAWSSGNYSSDTPDAQASSASGLTDCGDLTGMPVLGSYPEVDPVDCSGDSLENWWSEEDLSFFQQHLFD